MELAESLCVSEGSWWRFEEDLPIMKGIADKLTIAVLSMAIVAVLSTTFEIAQQKPASSANAETPQPLQTVIVLRGHQDL
jgi:hypothetical protein